MFYISVTTNKDERFYLPTRNGAPSLSANLDDACMFANYQVAYGALNSIAQSKVFGTGVKYFEICTRHMIPEFYHVALKTGEKGKNLYVVSIRGNQIGTSLEPGEPFEKEKAEKVAEHLRNLTLADVILVRADV